MACFSVDNIKLKVKEHHVYACKYTVNEKLICLREGKSNHSDNAIKVMSKDEKKQTEERLYCETGRICSCALFGISSIPGSTHSLLLPLDFLIVF